MESALARMKEIDPEYAYLDFFGLEVMLIKGQWAEAEKTLPTLVSQPKFGSFLTVLVDKVPDSPEVPESFRGMVASDLANRFGNRTNVIPEQLYGLTRLQWSIGEKDKAIANAKRGVEFSKQPSQSKNFPPAAYEKFVGALEKGEMPSRDQMKDWTREAKAAAPAPATEN